jgi:hypothetical protein
MNKKERYPIIPLILTIAFLLLISGCVEVTPPTGTQNASSYALTETGGNLTSSLEKKTSSPTDTPGESGTTVNQTISGPDEKIPAPPVHSVVQTTPRSYEGLPTAAPTKTISSALVTTSAISPGEEFVTIYEINHSFVNDAIAYAYILEKPPLYINLKFSPVMGSDVISYQKRTGDKEGQIEITVQRPLKDAWFEMRIYDEKDGSIIMKEGYGKTYSQDNKSVALRTAGSYHFDFIGNYMDANIKLNAPRSLADISQMQDVNELLQSQKENIGKIPKIYLVPTDLKPGWASIGDIIHTDTEYQSMFKSNDVTMRQKIKKFTSTQDALSELENLKTAAGSDSMGPSLVGQGGFLVDKSQLKTQLIFVEGMYLIELSSFTPPNPVSATDLQAYGKMIISRIQTL